MTEQTTITRQITLDSQEEMVALLGQRDAYLRMVRETLDVGLFARGDTLHIEGSEQAVDQAERVYHQLRKILRHNQQLTVQDIRTVVEIVRIGGSADTKAVGRLNSAEGGRFLRPRTDGQARYISLMRENEIVVCVGPAGTGKTYLAVAMAVTQLRQGNIKRIVLVRPAVEAGERLGYLPGDLQAKINPYLRPLFDALNDMMEPDQVKRYVENEVIEIAPLAYMRGRTINQAFMILDEGQNTTVAQMKMFLTRMGHGSKIIVTGDMTQVDLPPTIRSGLADAVARLRGIDGLGIMHLDETDIVRHPLVQSIVKAYDGEGASRRRV